MSLLLLILYPIAIQYERGGWWRIVIPFFTIPAFIVDVIANYTELSLIYGLPRKGEYTFSMRLKRLSYLANWKGDLARWCIDYTNYFDPQNDHVL